jgi:hypothetical protein
MSALHEALERDGSRIPTPVDPVDLVVLAIGVVVAALRATPVLVAHQDHRRPLAEEERGHEVPPLPVAERDDLVIVRFALGAAVPAEVVRVTVAVLLLVRRVVLLVVADEVAEA